MSSIEKIGAGANNINFLVVANDKKFIFRLNVLLTDRKKARNQYNPLKLVEKLNIAPKAQILDDSRKIFDSDFIILNYIKGKGLCKICYSLNEKLIKNIAELFNKFHSLPIKRNLLRLPKEEKSYGSVLKKIKRLYNSISQDISDKKALSILL